jgi:hypothetical protein
MGSFIDNIKDLKYLCSRDNQTSRGFYILITVLGIASLLASLAGFICSCIQVVSGGLRIFGFAALPAVIVIIVGSVMFLGAKS